MRFLSNLLYSVCQLEYLYTVLTVCHINVVVVYSYIVGRECSDATVSYFFTILVQYYEAV